MQTQMQLRFETVMRALADLITAQWSRRLGGELTLSAAERPGGSGWLVTVPASGAATGRLTVWFERSSTVAGAVRALAADPQPSDEAVDRLVLDLVQDAASALESSAAGAGLTVGGATLRHAECPAGAQAFTAALADGLACRFAIVGDLTTGPADTRIEAVLDVDLPLVVRFGRAVMPMRALSDLGPGSVIDMSRAPDDPVELLVGDRLIARGEVVIVGGHYGVRITELAGGPAINLEARAS
jgi:flagellar motor switch protein FliN/FliY